MSKKYYKSLIILVLASTFSISCSQAPDNVRRTLKGDDALLNPKDSLDNVKPPSFEEFQQIVSNHCVPCHGAESSTFKGVSDMTALKSLEDWISYPDKLFVPGSAADSAVYNRLIFAKGTHEAHRKNMPFGTATIPLSFTEGEADLIGAFVNSIDSKKQEPLVYTDNYTALNKVKFIVSGAALTSDEMALAQSEKPSLSVEEIRSMVKRWYEQQDCRTTLSPLMAMSLQQNGTFTFRNEFLGDPNLGRAFPNENDAFINQASERISALKSNIQESFERTFCDLVDRNEPIHKIVSTRRWAMTTGMLATYLLVDTRAEINIANTSLTTNLADPNRTTLEDFRDWRFVNFIQPSQNNQKPRPRNLGAIRAFADESNFPLVIPRVGFFNTLGFQLLWETNNDNQFRLTTNQALIATLGQSFSAADQTKEGNLAGLDAEHAPQNSDCYSCHRLIDPMRQVFKNVYAYTYRLAPNTQQMLQADFAFSDHKAELNSMDDLGQALASHPNFASAWVQKICSYANSQQCDQTSEEFSRLVSRFKESNYNFREMYFDVLSSPIVTGQNPNGNNKEMIDFRVASASKEQFCKLLNQRYRSAFQERGLDQAGLIDQVCRERGRSLLAQRGLGVIESARGTTELLKPSSHTASYLRSGELVCRDIAPRLVNGTGLFQFNSEANIKMSLDQMVKHIMGLSEAHVRYSLARSTIENVYQYGLEIGMNARNSMQESFMFACTSPDVMGVGL